MKSLAAKAMLLCMAHCIFGDLSAFVRAQEQRKSVDPESIQGCYDLTLSAWRPNLNLEEDAVFLTPPHRIQLFAEKGTHGWESEGYVVKPAPGAEPSVHRGSYWLPNGSQSMEIVWTTGFSGLVMGLKIKGTDLRGEAKSFWDFPRRRQTAEVTAHRVECQAGRASLDPLRADCQEDKAQPEIVAGEGWGPVRIGATSKTIDAFLGDGKSARKFSKVFFRDYVQKGIQVSFENDSGVVHSIYFYNGQRDDPEFRVFCGQVDNGINWQSSVDDVKKAYGQPTSEFSGTDSGGTWKRLIFDGIDFRFENEKMVRIGIPGN
jgi:hypothetical protein